MNSTVRSSRKTCNVVPGQRFAKWTTIKRVENSGHHHRWLCRCECGVERVVFQGNLTRGLSSGCIRCYADENVTHGMTDHPLYKTWKHMIDRCGNPKHHAYGRYGGRGISVCDRWLNSIAAFAEDMGTRPTPEHTLDRINNDGNYEPQNCRWATKKEQRNNQTAKYRYYAEINGIRKSVAEWCDDFGIKIGGVLRLVRIRGLSPEQALAIKRR